MVKQVKADKSNMLKSLFLKEMNSFLEIIATRFIF